MGRSSPPFLYGPSTYSFHGPTDRPFNPKAVTQASWTPKQSKPKPNGPLVNFNRHPDSYFNIPDGYTRWAPMSPRTKSKVKYGRIIQLGLRVLSLIGAAGALFCAAVIKGAAAITWIIRVGPIVAILHTLYGMYHLSRPMTRPPGTQASYMVFAAIFDLGLIPFYVFAAYIGREQYTAGSYNWDTIFGQSEVTHKIARSVFLISVVNGGLHAISLGISISLSVLFRQISQLPPDLNPLEDNLTARPHKRNKSELTEKHLSTSTLGSGLDDPLIGPPRQVPFMHTCGMSSGDDSSHFSSNGSQDQPPQVPVHHDYSFRPERPKREVRFRPLTSHPNVPISQVPVQNLDHVLARPTSAMIEHDPVWDPSAVPERSDCLSPVSESPPSDNWITYGSRSPSPVNDDRPPANEALLSVEEPQNEKPVNRVPSSMVTRSNTTASSNSTFRNWLNYSRYDGEVDQPIAETRGEYESLATNDYYGNDDDMRVSQESTLYDNLNNGQDLGDSHINIHLDDEARGQPSHPLPMNPLAMNPPTPQLTPDGSKPTRTALSDIPNHTPNQPTTITTENKNNRFYSKTENQQPIDAQPTQASTPSKHQTSKRKSKLGKAYSTLKQHDSPTTPPFDQTTDRKGRVVSNSGADIAIAAQRSPGSGSGLGSKLSYGNYIAGLGVGIGRRRDVSGKIAEEGRSCGDDGDASATGKSQSENTPTSTPRAAGWARFAGF